jgi:hypothetical protein
MSDTDLSRVENFTVWSENGVVIFEGYSDLRHIDLDEIINISPLNLSLYENLPSLKIPNWG